MLHPPVIPPALRPEALAAHAALEHSALLCIASGKATETEDGLTLWMFREHGEARPEAELALFSLMARGYVLPAPPARRGDVTWGWRLAARGEGLAHGAEKVPSVEALAVSYVVEARRPQHQLLCVYLGRGITGPVVVEVEAEHNGATWKAVVDFGKVEDAKPPATPSSLPIYGVELFRNGDRLPHRFTVLGTPVAAALWSGRPTTGSLVAPMKTLVAGDWPVLGILQEKIRGAGVALERAHPTGWGSDPHPHALVTVRTSNGYKARRVNVAALRLGSRSQWVHLVERDITTEEVDALADDKLLQEVRRCGITAEVTGEERAGLRAAVGELVEKGWAEAANEMVTRAVRGGSGSGMFYVALSTEPPAASPLPEASGDGYARRSDPRIGVGGYLTTALWSKQALAVRLLQHVQGQGRVAVAGAHKVGKTVAAAAAAIHFTQTFPRGRVVDVRYCMDHDLVASSMKRFAGPMVAVDSSQYVIVDAEDTKAPETIVNLAKDGPLLFVLDAAHLLSVEIYDAVMVALSTGRASCFALLLGVPVTLSDGSALHKAFHEGAEKWIRVTISAEEVPNVKAGEVLIPGLATREYLEEKRQEWGAESELYRTRMLAQWVDGEGVREIQEVPVLGEAYARYTVHGRAGGCGEHEGAVRSDVPTPFNIRKDVAPEDVRAFVDVLPLCTPFLLQPPLDAKYQYRFVENPAEVPAKWLDPTKVLVDRLTGEALPVQVGGLITGCMGGDSEPLDVVFEPPPRQDAPRPIAVLTEHVPLPAGTPSPYPSVWDYIRDLLDDKGRELRVPVDQDGLLILSTPAAPALYTVKGR